MESHCEKTPIVRSTNVRPVTGVVAALRYQILLTLFVFCGCAGPRLAEQSQVVTEGPWEVKQLDVAPLGFQFDIGPFRTSPIGVLHGKELRKIPKPEFETVHFLKDNAGMTFELTHANGQRALVRTGLADTGSDTFQAELVHSGPPFCDGRVVLTARLSSENSISRYPITGTFGLYFCHADQVMRFPSSVLGLTLIE